MTTTIMRDSIVGDAWINQAVAACPIQRIYDAAGNPTDNFLTGPVRLTFVDAWKLPAKKQGQTSDPKYGTDILFPPGVNFSPLYEEYYRIVGREFAEYYDAATQQYHGLYSPFRGQAEKLKHGGYTPGLTFMSPKTQFKPPVVDARMNPIVDESKCYAGVWAICAINAYPFGKNPPQPKKGATFGLQSIMIIGDDTNLARGKQADPSATFKGVNVTAPVTRPDFSQGIPLAAAPAPAAGIPGYTAPGGGVQRPGLPAGAPSVPQQHFVMPTQPVPQGVGSAEDDDMSFLN